MGRPCTCWSRAPRRSQPRSKESKCLSWAPSKSTMLRGRTLMCCHSNRLVKIKMQKMLRLKIKIRWNRWIFEIGVYQILNLVNSLIYQIWREFNGVNNVFFIQTLNWLIHQIFKCKLFSIYQQVHFGPFIMVLNFAEAGLTWIEVRRVEHVVDGLDALLL